MNREWCYCLWRVNYVLVVVIVFLPTQNDSTVFMDTVCDSPCFRCTRGECEQWWSLFQMYKRWMWTMMSLFQMYKRWMWTMMVPVSDVQEVNVNNDGPCFRCTRGDCEQWWSLFQMYKRWMWTMIVPVSDIQEVNVNNDGPCFRCTRGECEQWLSLFQMYKRWMSTMMVPVSDEQEVDVNNGGPCFRCTSGECEQWWSLFQMNKRWMWTSCQPHQQSLTLTCSWPPCRRFPSVWRLKTRSVRQDSGVE